MKTIIIDDEPKARDMTRKLLELHFPEIAVVGEAEGVSSGQSLIEKTNPDLVLLDVEMEDGTGFDLLSLVDYTSFRVIFITAHHAFAVDAFRFSALDYLLKPLVTSHFVEAINRAFEQWEQESFQLKLETLLTNLNAPPQKRKIVLKTAESMHVIPTVDIVRCQADGNYTTFFLNDERKVVVSRGIKEFENLLSPAQFLRIHQSHLINLEFLKAFLRREDAALLSDGSKVPVANRKRDALIKAIHAL